MLRFLYGAAGSCDLKIISASKAYAPISSPPRNGCARKGRRRVSDASVKEASVRGVPCADMIISVPLRRMRPGFEHKSGQSAGVRPFLPKET
jgi:hypothetical protein